MVAVTARPTSASGGPASYPAWARFDLGATATYTQSFAEGNDRPFARTLTYALQGLSLKRATVVLTVSEPPNAPESQLEQLTPDGPTNPPGLTPTGTDDVAVGGHTYHCRTYTARGKGLLPYNGLDPEALATVWDSDEVPGGLVRLRVRSVDRPAEQAIVSDQELTGTTGKPAAAGRALPSGDTDPVTTASMWVPFKPGSAATYTTTARASGGTEKVATVTFTLVGGNATEGAMLDVATSAGPGQPAQSGQVEMPAAGPMQPQWTQVGAEDVTAGGHVYHCRVYTTGATGAPQGKMWASTEVPGGIVRMHTVGPDVGTEDMMLSSCHAR